MPDLKPPKKQKMKYAPVMELVDMRDLGSRAAMRVGSSPFRRTMLEQALYRLLRLFSKVRACSFCCASFPTAIRSAGFAVGFGRRPENLCFESVHAFRFRKSPKAIIALGLLHPDRMYDSLNELPDLEQNMSRKTHLFRVHFYAVLSDFRNQTLRFFHLL